MPGTCTGQPNPTRVPQSARHGSAQSNCWGAHTKRSPPDSHSGTGSDRHECSPVLRPRGNQPLSTYLSSTRFAGSVSNTRTTPFPTLAGSPSRHGTPHRWPRHSLNQTTATGTEESSCTVRVPRRPSCLHISAAGNGTVRHTDYLPCTPLQANTPALPNTRPSDFSQQVGTGREAPR